MPENPMPSNPSVAIACGGTGGHLFPGVAVAEELRQRGCRVTLMVSPKDVDQKAIASISGMEIVTLPAVGLNKGGWIRFLAGFCKSYHQARRLFAFQRPDVVLAMGGFTSAPPVMAGRRCGAKTFLHESNSIPGRANRWLARWVDGAFVYFSTAASQLRAKRVEASGMPVRSQFLTHLTQGEARAALKFMPSAPLVLIMGGSQGASRINDLALEAVPILKQAVPDLQFMHLTGVRDVEKVQAGYKAHGAPALVLSFFDEMGTALAAADVAVSRAGASSLAELAARQLPSVLIPYPTAADNHQYFNARSFVQSGAARMLGQETATPGQLANEILDLLSDKKRPAMQQALAAWHAPLAAAQIAERILHWNKTEHASSHAGNVRPMTVPKMLTP